MHPPDTLRSPLANTARALLLWGSLTGSLAKAGYMAWMGREIAVRQQKREEERKLGVPVQITGMEDIPAEQRWRIGIAGGLTSFTIATLFSKAVGFLATAAAVTSAAREENLLFGRTIGVLVGLTAFETLEFFQTQDMLPFMQGAVGALGAIPGVTYALAAG